MIHFHYSYPSFRITQATAIKSWLAQVAKKEKTRIERLDYIFVTDKDLLQINRQALQHDYYTDIITFPLQKDPVVSEIYISIDRIKDHAQLYKVDFRHELHRVMVHGLLHLCGYTDKTKIEKKEMTAREDYWLKAMGNGQ